MTVNLRTYENGYYGYMNDHVRAAFGELQEAGGVRAVLTTASQLNSIEEPSAKDLAVVLDEQQLYAWNAPSASWVSIGASQSVLQQLIDGSFDGGVTTLLSTNTLVSGAGAAGTPDPLNTTAGWYYKNSADVTNAINWSYVANNNPAVTMTLANLTAQYAVVDVRAAGAPCFTIYTKPAGDGSDAALTHRSAMVYGPAGYDMTAYVGQTVFMHWGVDTGDFPSLPRVECTLDSSASAGPQDSAEEVLNGTFNTKTGYGAGYYEFVVSDLGYEFNTADVQYTLSAPTASDAPATLDEAFVRMDGVNDYLSLSGTGSIMDYTATWTVACEITELPSITTDNKFMTLWRSGNNGISLRRGGTNWGFYVANGYNSVAQANTWYAPSAGSRILVECDGTKISYWLDGVRRSHTTMNATHRDNSSHVVDSIDFGRGGISFGQGTYQDYEGGVDNMLFTNNILSSAEKAEWFAGGDVTTHSYYTAARDFVPCGEGVFPNVVGEKSNVTGSLVNGTSDDFVERT